MPQLNEKMPALFLGTAPDGRRIYANRNPFPTGCDDGIRTLLTNVCIQMEDDGQPDLSNLPAGTLIGNPTVTPGIAVPITIGPGLGFSGGVLITVGLTGTFGDTPGSFP